MGEDDGGQLVLVVKEMAVVDVGEGDLVLLPLTVWRGGRDGREGREEGREGEREDKKEEKDKLEETWS